MKKMKTLFVKEYEGEKSRNFTLFNKVTKGCEWVQGEGVVATVKLDGTCCYIKDGKLYARYDLKPGRKLPTDGREIIPCQDKADETTGHFPHWVEVMQSDSAYKWHLKAFDKLKAELKDGEQLVDGTYELIGEHFQSNPEHVESGDILEKHGLRVIEDAPTDFEGLKEYLGEHEIEGIVFHGPEGQMCKIKRTDFGFIWNGSDRKRH